jgi:hypothetical protein
MTETEREKLKHRSYLVYAAIADGENWSKNSNQKNQIFAK